MAISRFNWQKIYRFLYDVNSTKAKVGWLSYVSHYIKAIQSVLKENTLFASVIIKDKASIFSTILVFFLCVSISPALSFRLKHANVSKYCWDSTSTYSIPSFHLKFFGEINHFYKSTSWFADLYTFDKIIWFITYVLKLSCILF